MRRARATVAGAGCMILLLAAAVAAQEPIDPDAWEPAPSDPRSAAAVRQRFAAPLAVYDYPSVWRALQQEFERSPIWNRDEPIYHRLSGAFRLLNERFDRFESDLAAAVDRAERIDAFLERYPTGLFQFPCPGRICFRDDLEVSYDDVAQLPRAQAEDFLYRVQTIDQLLNDFKRPAIEATVNAIAAAERRWDLYLKEGMSQFPWEAAINGWLIGGGSIEFPPRRQWIVLHPELGVEVSTDGLESLRAKESGTIELLGHVWYRWPGRDRPEAELRWWGVAAAATLRDDLRPGLGVIGHYGRFVTLGVIWHDTDADDDWFDQAPFVMMGIDLFRFASERAPAFQKRAERALALRRALLR